MGRGRFNSSADGLLTDDETISGWGEVGLGVGVGALPVLGVMDAVLLGGSDGPAEGCVACSLARRFSLI